MGETFQRFQYGLLAFFLFFGESYGDPPHPGDCSNFGSECKYDANSHLDTIMHVNSLDECHQLCLDQEFCEFVTYYYDGNYENMCMLFRSCSEATSCSFCYTDWIGCDRNCLSNTVGVLDENVIETIPETETFQDCRNLCKHNANCS